MAWVIEDWIIHNIRKGSNDITVDWTQENSADTMQKKTGSFAHTLDGDKTWAVNKTDIETKITANDGART